MSLEDEDGFFHGNFPMCRWPIILAVEFRVVRLILLEHIVDDREQHPGNGDDSLFVPSALFECEVTVADFRELFGTNRTEGALYQQWLDVSPSPADSGGFLLSGALVVLRRKTSPGAKMLRGWEHRHIHSDFRDNADSGKGLDTWCRHNKVKLRKIFLSSCQNQRFQIEFAQFKAVHVGTDDAELFSLFFTHHSVHSSEDFLVSRFHVLGAESRNIRDFLRRVVQNTDSDGGGCLAEHIREHIIQFKVGDSQAVLRPIFLTGGEAGKFPTITEQVSKLADICRRDKTPSDKVVLEDVCDPLGISLVCFLPPNGFHILGVSEDDVAGGLQNVVNGNPILSGGFHAHILAVVFSQPNCAPPQISGECGKALTLVSCHSIFICGSDTGNDKRLVDIHPAADTINDFKHNTSPRNSI